MSHEQIIYTRSWAAWLSRHFVRDLGRSAAFGFILLLGFIFLLGIPLIVYWGAPHTSSDSWEGDYFGGAIVVFLVLGIPLFVLCCWGALEVADDRHWERHEPTVWDENQTRWIRSTVAFSRYLEERGSHINAALVQYNDPRRAAHRMIDQVDEQTLALYLSLLSAVQLERERVRIESVDVTPKNLEGKAGRAGFTGNA